MNKYLAAFAALAMVFTVGACDDDEVVDPDPDPLLTGMITVSATTSGTDLDANGYTAIVQEDTLIDNNPSFNPDPESQDLGINGSTTFDNQVTGPQSVELSGIAVNCVVAGGNPREVRVELNETTTVEYTVTCTSDSDGAPAFVADDL